MEYEFGKDVALVNDKGDIVNVHASQFVNILSFDDYPSIKEVRRDFPYANVFLHENAWIVFDVEIEGC